MGTNYKKYNPEVSARLKSIYENKQWDQITPYLEGLTNSRFYTASYMLGDSLLPKMEADDFWTVVTLLYNYSPKAFLSLCMRVAGKRQEDLEHPKAEALWKRIAETPVEVQKTLFSLLPMIKDNVPLVEHLLNVMNCVDPHDRIAFLLQFNTPATAYLLLLAVRRIEEDRTLVLRTTYYLIKKGDALSYNMASLFKVFFGLDEVRGTFSLRLEPYELARLENDYEAFKKKVVE